MSLNTGTEGSNTESMTEAATHAMEEMAEATIPQTTLNRRKVLVVEDDSDMAQLTRFLIEQFSGARCDIVVDSYEAIEALCDNNYDYLVVDQNLPGMKGIEILIKLDSYLDTDPILAEQSRFTHKIPVLLMSAGTINVPYGLKLTHFEITDSINKRDLNLGLAKNFAS
jgi:CheY-like chemotaxis protein